MKSILDGFWKDFGSQVGGKIASNLHKNLTENFDWKKGWQNEARWVTRQADEEGPAAEAGGLEFDKIDLDLNPARSCPARGPADIY